MKSCPFVFILQSKRIPNYEDRILNPNFFAVTQKRKIVLLIIVYYYSTLIIIDEVLSCTTMFSGSRPVRKVIFAS